MYRSRVTRNWLPKLNVVNVLFIFTVLRLPCRGGDVVDDCIPRFSVPTHAPDDATAYNGIRLHACFNYSGPHHVFVIGDWGGHGVPPRPADRRGPAFPEFARSFVDGVDDCAQQRVAAQMKKKAVVSNPDYVLNVGNSFYWAGITVSCGARPYGDIDTNQWNPVFEDMYLGPGLDGKPWIGVLGNHDYGGWTFTQGWDQMIGRTWSGPPASSGRWIMPAQYWTASVKYSQFSVDYFFIDSNAFDAYNPDDKSEENICGLVHTPENASCGAQGPTSVWDCPRWFQKLWAAEIVWIESRLSQSNAEWQIVVTHFPPLWGKEGWSTQAMRHGIDLFVSGHVHKQEVHYLDDPEHFLSPSAWIVSGGGGGITSEGAPNVNGSDDQYGFMDLLLTKDTIVIEAISHGGQIRSRTEILPRFPAHAPSAQLAAKRDVERNKKNAPNVDVAATHDDNAGGLRKRTNAQVTDDSDASAPFSLQRPTLSWLTHWTSSPLQNLVMGGVIGIFSLLMLAGCFLWRFDWSGHHVMRASYALLFQCSSKRCCSYTEMPLATEDSKRPQLQSYEFTSVPLDPLDIRDDEEPTMPDTSLGTGCGCWRPSRNRRWLPPSEQSRS